MSRVNKKSNLATKVDNIQNKINAKKEISNRSYKPIPGYLGIILWIAIYAGLIALTAHLNFEYGILFTLITLPLLIIAIVFSSLKVGFITVNPNENAVITVFGNYRGTIIKPGMYIIHPFAKAVNNLVLPAKRKINVKTSIYTHVSDTITLCDKNATPIEIAVKVDWRVIDSAKAVFCVGNHIDFVKQQSQHAISELSRKYIYEKSSNIDDEILTLTGNKDEIDRIFFEQLQSILSVAGVEVIIATISHLSYCSEMRAALIKKNQIKALLETKKSIVEGAVGMVEMALEQLRESGCVELDEERKAQMVSNLMVVLCSNNDTQPIVNTGTIY